MLRLNKLYIGFVAVFFALALIFGGVVPYYVFYLSVAVLILSILYALIIGAGIGFSIHVPRNIFTCGDTVECSLKVMNPVYLPVPYIMVRSAAEGYEKKGYAGSVISMTAAEDNWKTLRLRFAGRGIYPLGKLTVTVWDVFHIVRYEKTMDAGLTVKVYPRLYPVQGLIHGAADIYKDTYASHGKNENQYTTQDIRAYRDGDSLKRVHWKVSAKREELFVKNYERVTGTETALFIDLNHDNYTYGEDSEERIMDTAMSIVKQMVAHHVDIKVFLNSETPMQFQVHTMQQFDGLMEYSLSQPSDGHLDFLEFLQRYYYQIPRTSAITVILATVTEKAMRNILAIKKNGYAVNIVYCVKADDPALIGELGRWGVRCAYAPDLCLTAEASVI